jgi:hypothetical protein
MIADSYKHSYLVHKVSMTRTSRQVKHEAMPEEAESAESSFQYQYSTKTETVEDTQFIEPSDAPTASFASSNHGLPYPSMLTPVSFTEHGINDSYDGGESLYEPLIGKLASPTFLTHLHYLVLRCIIN